jgi:hypothetical protein
MKTCVTCPRKFVPSSNHRSCPACRSRPRAHRPCPVCSNPMNRRSNRCQKCFAAINVVAPKNPNWKATLPAIEIGTVTFTCGGSGTLAARETAATFSSTSSSWKPSSDGICFQARTCTIAMDAEMTIGPRISNCGCAASQTGVAWQTQSHGPGKSWPVTKLTHLWGWVSIEVEAGSIETPVQSRSIEDVLQACSVIWISRFGPPPTGSCLRQPSDLLRTLPGVRCAAF